MASQLTGARLLLHPRATYPRVMEDGINLLPGTLTDIRFSTIEWSMLEPPYGRCSSNTPAIISFNHVNYSYSEEACNLRNEQQKIANSCKCLHMKLPIPTELVGKGIRICEEFNFPATHSMLQKVEAKNFVYHNKTALDTYSNYAGCIEFLGKKKDREHSGCRPACIRYTYKPSITAAQWPTKTFLSWFATKVKSVIMRRDFYQSMQTSRVIKKPNQRG